MSKIITDLTYDLCFIFYTALLVLFFPAVTG